MISIDTEKGFDKIQHPFITKTLNKLCIEALDLNIIKAVYDNLTANIKHEKLNDFHVRSLTR